jgi:pimeloyl-ACP methyl ester carboxylesterase
MPLYPCHDSASVILSRDRLDEIVESIHPPVKAPVGEEYRAAGWLTHLTGRWRPLPPLWRESLFGLEYLALLRDPIHQGAGLLPGNGYPVMLVPGFLAGDYTLATMFRWLKRHGYRPRMSGISFNVGASNVLVREIAARLRRTHELTGLKTTVIGQSRGGLLAKVVGDRHPELVDQVISLGSPLADPYDVGPATMAAVNAARVTAAIRYGRLATDERNFLATLAGRPQVPTTSVYTRGDGIVHWRSCVRADVRMVEVNTSHVGMAVNPQVYRVIARLLAEHVPDQV